jgi:hypothetical protein
MKLFAAPVALSVQSFRPSLSFQQNCTRGIEPEKTETAPTKGLMAKFISEGSTASTRQNHNYPSLPRPTRRPATRGYQLSNVIESWNMNTPYDAGSRVLLLSAYLGRPRRQFSRLTREKGRVWRM